MSVNDYLSKNSSGASFEKEKITLPVLIALLEKDCYKTLNLVENIEVTKNTSLMYEVADVKTWSNLGLYLAEKLKGAIALETYNVSGGDNNKQEAIYHLESALAFWDEVISITRPIYKDKPLIRLQQHLEN